jgi:hypothetical protein
LGLAAAWTVTWTLLPFMAFGAFIVFAYNLESFGGRFHSDLWFALSWGAFPAATAYWANSPQLGLALPAVAAFCFLLSLVQRHLSNRVRLLRRKAAEVEGAVLLTDGSAQPLDLAWLLALPERVLKLLALSMVLLAVTLVAARLVP